MSDSFVNKQPGLINKILTIVRHGETVWNNLQILQGQLDSDLTQTGIEQIKATAEKLQNNEIDQIYSSDLGRAYQSAKIIGDVLNIPVYTDRNLRERCFGIFQGLSKSQLTRKYPVEYQIYLSGNLDYVIPEGESANQARNRVIVFIEKKLAKSLCRNLVIVGHLGTFEAVYTRFLKDNGTIPRTHIRNGMILTIRLGSRVSIKG